MVNKRENYYILMSRGVKGLRVGINDIIRLDSNVVDNKAYFRVK